MNGILIGFVWLCKCKPRSWAEARSDVKSLSLSPPAPQVESARHAAQARAEESEREAAGLRAQVAALLFTHTMIHTPHPHPSPIPHTPHPSPTPLRDGRWVPGGGPPPVRQWSRGSGIVSSTSPSPADDRAGQDEVGGQGGEGGGVEGVVGHIQQEAVGVPGGDADALVMDVDVDVDSSGSSGSSSSGSTDGSDSGSDGGSEPPRPKWTKKMLRVMSFPARPEKVAMALFGLQVGVISYG